MDQAPPLLDKQTCLAPPAPRTEITSIPETATPSLRSWPTLSSSRASTRMIMCSSPLAARVLRARTAIASRGVGIREIEHAVGTIRMGRFRSLRSGASIARFLARLGRRGRGQFDIQLLLYNMYFLTIPLIGFVRPLDGLVL